VQRFPKASFAAVIVVWASAFSVIKALLDHGIGAEQIALARYLIAGRALPFSSGGPAGSRDSTARTHCGSESLGSSSSPATTSS